MKTLLLITDLQIGGTPTVVRELAERLPADVACLAGEGPVASRIRAAGQVVTPFHLRHTVGYPLAVWRLVRLIRANRYDAVISFLLHANAVAAGAAVFCRGTRFIQSIQTTQPHPQWHWRVQSLIHRAADTILVPTPSVAAVAAERCNIHVKKMVVIPNAVDLPEKQGHREWSNRIGYIGRLDPIKRIGDLIEAIASMPGYRLDIFGEGGEQAAIERSIQQLALTDRVTLHGAIGDPQMALNQIDVLVLPSAAEGFGLVLIEAMAAGVPVVATDAPGIRDVVIAERTGLLVPVADPPAIAAALQRLADPALRTRLSFAGRDEVARRFTWDIVLPQYREMLTNNQFH